MREMTGFIMQVTITNGVLEVTDDGTALVTFDKPVRAAAPGQALVFYDETGTYIYGGGTII